MADHEVQAADHHPLAAVRICRAALAAPAELLPDPIDNNNIQNIPL